ncbi:MAG: hypothetical protein ACRET4_17335 [Steroidobacteraceae bacterium]
MSLSIDIERLSISLHGVSAQVAAAAASGLDGELRRRLGALAGRGLTSGDLGSVRLGSIAVSGTLDAAQLRGLIVERLLLALTDSPPGRDGGGEA